MTKKKKVTAATTAIVAAALLFAGSFAWVSTLQTATNKFRQNDYNVQLHDVFEGKEVVTNDSETGEYISETVEWKDTKDTLNKDIWVTNNGSGDILVRVRLTESLKVQKHSQVSSNVKNNIIQTTVDGAGIAGYSSATKTIHDNVQWNLGESEWLTSDTIITYNEWNTLPDDNKFGAFWVIDTDGWIYWMEPLVPSVEGSTDTPKAIGNTDKLLDSVTLLQKEGQIDYSIKVEMDAIDAELNGLMDLGTTWNNKTGNVLTLAKAAASSSLVKELLNAKNVAGSKGAQMLYDEAISSALLGVSSEEIETLKTKAEAAENAYNKDPDAATAPVMEKDINGNVMIGETAIEPAVADALAIHAGYADKDGNVTDYSVLTKDDLVGITNITVTAANVSSLAGITAKDFPNLTEVNLSGTVDKKHLNITNETLNTMDPDLKQQVKILDVHNCNLSGTVDLQSFSNLEAFSAFNNSEKVLEGNNITNLVNLPSTLKRLDVGYLSNLESIDASNCKQLEFIGCYKCTGLTSINGIQDMEKLIYINLSCTKLTTVDLSKASELIYYSARDMTELTSLKFSEKAFMKMSERAVECGYQPLLFLQGCGQLTSFNDQSIIDISKMTLISSLSADRINEGLMIKKRKSQTITPTSFPSSRIIEVEG